MSSGSCLLLLGCSWCSSQAALSHQLLHECRLGGYILGIYSAQHWCRQHKLQLRGLSSQHTQTAALVQGWWKTFWGESWTRVRPG